MKLRFLSVRPPSETATNIDGEVKPGLSVPACSWRSVANLEVVETRLVFAPEKPEGALGEINGVVDLSAWPVDLPVEMRGAGHVAYGYAGSSPARSVGVRAVDQVHIMEGQLSRFQLDVDGLGLIKGRVVDPLVEHHVISVFFQVLVQFRLAVRAGDHPETAIVRKAVVDGDPGCASCQRADRPVMTILVPGDLHAIAARFAPRAARPPTNFDPL